MKTDPTGLVDGPSVARSSNRPIAATPAAAGRGISVTEVVAWIDSWAGPGELPVPVAPTIH